MIDTTFSHRLKCFDEIPKARPITPLLDRINNPYDLKTLTADQLPQLADELREFLLYSIGVSGGHFGANLGVVELTIVLHFLFETPKDKLIWDVGHQTYPHKVLTGRRELLPQIRHQGGLTAFPERGESEYDTFGVGHSSTAISAGVGMALALSYQNQDHKVVCVVGDGAMTGGMAFEAMNDAIQNNVDLIVVLNDNDMSISCATGGFAKHLSSLWQAGYQVNLDDHGNAYLRPRPNMFKHRLHKDLPHVEDNLFKAIGFQYFGPFDGHDIPELLRVFEKAKHLSGCILIHICTVKGRGFLPAESDPIGYHAIAKIHGSSVKSSASAKKIKKYSQVFGEFLCDKAQQDKKLMAITPAMAEGSGMVTFAKKFAKQFFDVAIAEQHAVTVAGGMATQGLKPIVAIYSTFLQRGYDQLIHDVALQNLDVMFAIDRAGLVGEDGATHAGVFDYAYLRCVPNLVIACPADENECYHLLNTCYEYQGVTAVRYPRGEGIGIDIEKPAKIYPIGQAQHVITYHPHQNHKIAILAFGSVLQTVKQVAQTLETHYPDWQISVYNMRFVKPLDTDLLQQLSIDHQGLVTVEEHQIMGGAGSAVNECMLQKNTNSSYPMLKILNLGIEDKFIAHASHAQQLADCGLDDLGIYQKIDQFIQTLSSI